MKISNQPSFEATISVENLLLAWQEFLHDKKHKKDVQEFQLYFMDTILDLHQDLVSKKYSHGSYEAFAINDPKPRSIHKASVRDRLLHHAIYRILYPYFDNLFIFDFYSCRRWKGTHKALKRFEQFGRKVSKSNTRPCYILKCDVRKFFASIDHQILIKILGKHIKDTDILWLLKHIIESFSATPSVGLPLGNLTSQLLVNIYMNEFDQYMKHALKRKWYIRYADDFVIVHEDRIVLEETLPKIAEFLETRLKLQLHPDKVFIRQLSQGVDFLGWVHFPYHRVLRTATKKRMFRRIRENPYMATLNSYKGMLAHGNGHKLAAELDKMALNGV